MPRARPRRVRSRRPTEHVIPKEAFAKEIDRILQDRQLTQTEAAYLVKDAPSQISLMVTGKLHGFSIERLVRTLSRLGRNIDIVISKTSGGRPGKIRVVRK